MFHHQKLNKLPRSKIPSKKTKRIILTPTKIKDFRGAENAFVFVRKRT